VYMIVEGEGSKPRRRLLEAMEKLGLQCDVSVKVCMTSKGEVEMYPGFSIIEILDYLIVYSESIIPPS